MSNLFCQLRDHGYTNIDAIDGSRDMLRLAEEKQLYGHYYVSLLGGQHVAPFDDGNVLLLLNLCAHLPSREINVRVQTPTTPSYRAVVLAPVICIRMSLPT